MLEGQKEKQSAFNHDVRTGDRKKVRNIFVNCTVTILEDTIVDNFACKPKVI